MKNSLGLDFNKILDQTLYTYMTQKVSPPEDESKPSQVMTDSVAKPWPVTLKMSLVMRLWPICMLIGVLEVVVGIVLLIFVVLKASEYDQIYATENTKIISLMSFGGLITLVGSGVTLLISLVLENKRIMWFYILTATFLCVYIFVLAVMKIHFALLVLERDTYKALLPENRHFLLSTACVVGIVTLLGSVVHFTGNVTVLTFYNLKYIQPILYSSGP